MKWTVEATDPTSWQEQTFDVEAETAAEAEQQASTAGWLITRVYRAGEPPVTAATFSVWLGSAGTAERTVGQFQFVGTIAVSADGIEVKGTMSGGNQAAAYASGLLLGHRAMSIMAFSARQKESYRLDPSTTRGYFDVDRRTISLHNPTASWAEGQWVVLKPRGPAPARDARDLPFEQLQSALTAVLGSRFEQRPLGELSWKGQVWLVAAILIAVIVVFGGGVIAYLVATGAHSTLPW